jgi:haloacetate dehalogenase
MIEGFHCQTLTTTATTIHLAKGGTGYPLLLLHGYPQNHVLWHKIAPRLAEFFTVISADLRGYGDSGKPIGGGTTYSKRAMAQDQVEAMEQLGYGEFYLVGHDRGGRVAHRLALDYPEKVKKLALLDIAPTYDMYLTSDREFATAYYHWFFLSQPYPFPETLIGANPDYFLNYCLASWSKTEGAFTPQAIAEYQRCFRQPETIHATCEDYRAAATIDLIHDSADRDRKIDCPTLILWGQKGFIERQYDVLSVWRERARDLRGEAIACGHFLPEEAPNETYRHLVQFLGE